MFLRTWRICIILPMHFYLAHSELLWLRFIYLFVLCVNKTCFKWHIIWNIWANFNPTSHEWSTSKIVQIMPLSSILGSLVLYHLTSTSSGPLPRILKSCLPRKTKLSMHRVTQENNIESTWPCCFHHFYNIYALFTVDRYNYIHLIKSYILE